MNAISRRRLWRTLWLLSGLLFLLGNFSPNLNAQCTPAPSGLVAWWLGESNVLDSIGTNIGTLQGNAGFISGEVGHGFHFDGVNGYVQAADSPAWAFSSNEFTIELWVRFASVQQQNVFVANDEGSGSTHKWIFWINGGVLQFTIQQAAFNGQSVGSHTFAPVVNQFYHLALTRSGNIYTFYTNGVALQTETNALDIPDPAAPLTIGGCPAENVFTASTMDEISIYHRKLTPTEITAIYNAGAAGKCPAPASIIAQPLDQIVNVGETATLSVLATGTGPLGYQWNFNHSNIVNATTAVLTLTNVQPGQAGVYSVQVSNAIDSVLSSNALLTVNIPQCTPPPSGVVAWWRAQGDAVDTIGTNHATFHGGATLTTGKVGQGFGFDGTNGYLQALDSPAWAFSSNEFTIELWVRFASVQQQNVFVANDEGSGFTHKWFFWINGGALQFFVQNATFSGESVGSHAFAPITNQFYHLALTRSGNIYTFYTNGVALQIETNALDIPDPAAPLTIGGCPAENIFTTCTMDEISIYHRRLTPSEIFNIFNSAAEGKCAPPPAPPSIFTQPTDTQVFIGDASAFNVLAIGDEPLSYQWRFNGTNIQGATNLVFSFSDAQFSQAGSYSVLVTNALGSVISSNAALFVDFLPATIAIVSTNTMGSALVTVPIKLLANGNEAACGFSLQFDTNELMFVGVDPDENEADTTILLNTNFIGLGKVGIAIIPPDTFLPRTQDIARVTFKSHFLISAGPVDTSIHFSDDPLIRELINPQLRDLPANYSDGNVTLYPTGFEGDLSPRPAGNQTFSTADWLQAGRFVARLDTPFPGEEFQRMDSAPRQTLGDGQLKVTDWVQAGRYFAGIDPFSFVGGPASESLPTNAGPSLSRRLYLPATNVVQGQSATVSVKLDAQGNENAVGFTFGFDSGAFTFSGVTLGAGMTGVNLIANTNQVGSGKLGVVLALSPGGTFAAGTKELLKVSLLASPSVFGTSPLTLTDQFVTRCVSDSSANELPASYFDGSLTLNSPNPSPLLSISRVDNNAVVSWPFSASDFTLEMCGENTGLPGAWTDVHGPFQTNSGKISLTTSVTNQMLFFRLYR